jgi:hypothetical protein
MLPLTNIFMNFLGRNIDEVKLASNLIISTPDNIWSRIRSADQFQGKVEMPVRFTNSTQPA